jgi:hypothetical protein
MRNQNPEIVEILEDTRGKVLFKCKICGVKWSPNIKPESNGKFYRGAWQCPNGCKPDRR